MTDYGELQRSYQEAQEQKRTSDALAAEVARTARDAQRNEEAQFLSVARYIAQCLNKNGISPNFEIIERNVRTSLFHGNRLTDRPYIRTGRFLGDLVSDRPLAQGWIAAKKGHHGEQQTNRGDYAYSEYDCLMLTTDGGLKSFNSWQYGKRDVASTVYFIPNNSISHDFETDTIQKLTDITDMADLPSRLRYADVPTMLAGFALDNGVSLEGL